MKVDKTKWKQKIISDCIKTIKVKNAIQKKDYQQYGKYPIISQEKDYISGYCDSIENLNSIGKVIIFGDHTRVLKFVDFDFCVGADGVKVIQPNFDISTKYLFYFLKWADIPSNGYSRHFKFLKKLNISYPSLSNQQLIEAELDAIQTMIDSYKAQLEDLNVLAQSIFLDMFGDPVSNPKGWEVKRWEEVFFTCTGKLDSNSMEDNGIYPFFTCSKDILRINTYAFDCEALLLAGNNASGDYDVKYYKGKFNAYQRTYVLTLKNKDFMYHIFKFQLENRLLHLKKASLGSSTKYLTLKILNNLNFIIPPLSLQQQFAEQVEAIEKQKDLLREQLKDAETLMAERMQYYFS